VNGSGCVERGRVVVNVVALRAELDMLLDAIRSEFSEVWGVLVRVAHWEIRDVT
jgi:hypothetical protein